MKAIIPYLRFAILMLLILCFRTYLSVSQDIDTSMSSVFEMSLEELMDAKVTIATKSPQKISESPAVVSVITAEDIKNMGARDLEEVLQTIPGFEFTQTRLGSKPFVIRGVSDIRQGGKLLVLLDGIPFNDIMYGSSVFYGASFNIDAVKRIEVIRGPGSALYGRNAFSGVINIITKSAESAKVSQIELGAKLGSYKTSDFNGSYGLNKNDFNSYFSIKKYYTDGTDSEFLNGEGTKSVWNIYHDNFYSNLNLKYKKLSFNGFYSSIQNGASAGPFMTQSSVSQKIGTYILAYNSALNLNVKWQAKIFGRNEYRDDIFEYIEPNTVFQNPYDKPLYRPFYVSNPEGVYANPHFKAYTYGTSLEFSIESSSKNSLLLGLQIDAHGVKDAKVKTNYELTTYKPLFYTSGTDNVYFSKDDMEYYKPGWIDNDGHDYINTALFVQNVYHPIENIGITLGGRLDYDSEIGLQFNPRVGMVYGATSKLNFKLLYGRAYRLPTTNEQYKFVGADVGNKNLNSEVINSYEFVINHQSKKMYNQISCFYNNLDNLIYQDNMPDNPIYKSYYNQGKNLSYGFEFDNKIYFSKTLYSFFNYSFAHSKDVKTTNGVDDERKHPNMSPHKFNVGVNYLVFSKLNFNLNAKYRSPITKFQVVNKEGVKQDISQDVVGDFLLINSTVRLINIIKGLELSASCYNIFDKDYYFQDNENKNQPKQNGRHFLFTISYNF